MSGDDNARDCLVELFGVVASRLQSEKGVSATYDYSAVETLLARREWRDTIQPLMALKHLFHKTVADPIEAMLLDKQLVASDRLEIVGGTSVNLLAHRTRPAQS
jgi:hypothetical protein